METPRHSQAVEPEIVTDPIEKARKESANALEQTAQVQAMIAEHVADGKPFRLRTSTVLALHRTALSGLSAYAGNFRPAGIEIGESEHEPPEAHMVPELIEQMCDYVNEHWDKSSPVHLCAYVMWRLNWIHPFTDGNGRTARALAYLVLSVGAHMLTPGENTIPEQIIANRTPYYDAQEEADAAFQKGSINVDALEELLAGMLHRQLLSVAELASGTTHL